MRRFDFSSIKSKLWHGVTFVILLLLYVANEAVVRLVFKLQKRFPNQEFLSKFFNSFVRKYNQIINFLERNRPGRISQSDIIDLAIANMRVKKTRTLITIGGMTIGIGAIVFLVSLGYGVQKLVISRVARLEEIKQADVSVQAGSKVKITDKTLSDLKALSGLESAQPLIAVVGKVNYQNSETDMAAYGVTSQYLEQSAVKPIKGKIFDSNELVFELPSTPEVAGVSTISGEIVHFAINSGSWIRVREDTTATAKILGYTKKEAEQSGVEVTGGSYVTDFGKDDKWISSRVLLWKQEKCEVDKGECEDGKYVPLRDEDGKQVREEGYFAELGVTVNKEGQVLADATESGSLESIEIASEAGVVATSDIKKVPLSPNAKRQAVVNRAMLKVLGLSENDAIGKKFDASFIVVGDLLSDPTEQIQSAKSEYTIVGLIADDKTPVFYVPFIDLRSLGIQNYSQAKITVKNANDLGKIRKQVEAMGYITRSVVDTVDQINSLFGTARAILALLGMVALTVAALGMFNTLTVSLLERTREVGLLKAMGMRSEEVRELFLTESILMGFFGGIGGLILGVLAGKLVGVLLSSVAVFKGGGFLDVSSVPWSMTFLIILLSLGVGIITGFYPARRATKISALNALRYE